jgi:hypothetical protein
MHSPAAQTGHEHYLKAGMAIHLCIRNAREEQTGSRSYWNHGSGGELPESSGQRLVVGGQSNLAGSAEHWPRITDHCLSSLRELLPEPVPQ